VIYLLSNKTVIIVSHGLFLSLALFRETTCSFQKKGFIGQSQGISPAVACSSAKNGDEFFVESVKGLMSLFWLGVYIHAQTAEIAKGVSFMCAVYRTEEKKLNEVVIHAREKLSLDLRIAGVCGYPFHEEK
jgi:hypothetical protein